MKLFYEKMLVFEMKRNYFNFTLSFCLPQALLQLQELKIGPKFFGSAFSHLVVVAVVVVVVDVIVVEVRRIFAGIVSCCFPRDTVKQHYLMLTIFFAKNANFMANCINSGRLMIAI